MKQIILSIIFLISVFLFSCEQAINIEPQHYDSKISIQSLLTPNTFPKVYLNKTVPYFDAKISNRDLFVPNASVKIISSNGTDNLRVDSTLNEYTCEYQYYYRGSNIILSNTSYNLEIVANGVTYTAGTNTNEIKVQIDSVSYVSAFEDIYGEHEGVVLYFRDNPLYKNYYRYEMNRMVDSSSYSWRGKSPCLGSQKIWVQEIGRSIYSNETILNHSLSFAFEPTYKHKNNDTVYIKLQSCDKNMFEFYDQLDKQKLSQFNPFVEPVFIKSGQFNNAFGVFGSYILSDSVVFVYPE